MLLDNRSRTAVIALAMSGFAVCVALASRFGAAPAHTGGASSNGADCTVCHSLNAGPGGVEIVNLPNRYRAGTSYEFNVVVFDSQQAGAGFQISAEGKGAHRGTLVILDALRTQFAESDPDYVTHTQVGVDVSVAAWQSNAGSVAYAVGWQAPPVDEGPVTFFAAGNAIDNAVGPFGDRFYATHVTSHYAIPGDADADGDLDLADFLVMQTCFGEPVSSGVECQYLDMDDDEVIAINDTAKWTVAITGPTAPDPGAFVLADAVRGGVLYDKWWPVIGAPAPVGDHPLYPQSGAQSGSVTYRCKECHGWDYKGVDGKYGSGSHFTGIRGVLGSALSSQQIVHLLRAAPSETPNGHNLPAYGLTDRDLWDLAKFVREGLVDTDTFIDDTGAFQGDASEGSIRYGQNCIYCHGKNGDALNFGTPSNPEYVGTVANKNPWELLHKIRVGHPASPMPATELLGWSTTDLVNLGSHCQLLAQ